LWWLNAKEKISAKIFPGNGPLKFNVGAFNSFIDLLSNLIMWYQDPLQKFETCINNNDKALS